MTVVFLISLVKGHRWHNGPGGGEIGTTEPLKHQPREETETIIYLMIFLVLLYFELS
jgi:hypothetical protein